MSVTALFSKRKTSTHTQISILRTGKRKDEYSFNCNSINFNYNDINIVRYELWSSYYLTRMTN